MFAQKAAQVARALPVLEHVPGLDAQALASLKALVRQPGNSQAWLAAADGWDGIGRDIAASWEAVSGRPRSVAATSEGQTASALQDHVSEADKRHPAAAAAAQQMAAELRKLQGEVDNFWTKVAEWVILVLVVEAVATMFFPGLGLVFLTGDLAVLLWFFHHEFPSANAAAQAAFDRVRTTDATDARGLGTTPPAAGGRPNEQLRVSTAGLRQAAGDLHQSADRLGDAAARRASVELGAGDFAAGQDAVHTSYAATAAMLLDTIAGAGPSTRQAGTTLGQGSTQLATADTDKAAALATLTGQASELA